VDFWVLESLGGVPRWGGRPFQYVLSKMAKTERKMLLRGAAENTKSVDGSEHARRIDNNNNNNMQLRICFVDIQYDMWPHIYYHFNENKLKLNHGR
jgi:hypothetical protein